MSDQPADSDLEAREADLFRKARALPPPDPELLGRVSARLSARQRGAPRRSTLALGGAVFAGALLAVTIAGRGRDPAPPSAPPVVPPALQAVDHSPQAIEPPAPPPREAPPKLLTRPVKGLRAAAPSAPAAAEPTPAEPAAPVAIAPAPPDRPEPPLPATIERRTYVPRAIREFQDLDWVDLERKPSLAALRPYIDRRDAPGLLAALDRYPVGPPAEILVIRGVLRAGAHRCPEALDDFDRALRTTPELELQTRAQAGQAACEDAIP